VVVALFALVAAFVVAADQLTKLYAVRVFARQPLDLGLVRLVDVRNPNAAFSIPGFPGLFIIVTVVVVVLVARVLRHTDVPLLGTAYGLVVGGALGNATDRVFRAPGFPSGAVVDWIDLGWFPVFNLADSAITVGAALLLLLLSRIDRRERAAAAGAGGPAAVRTAGPRAEGWPVGHDEG
jgi:signal peptidase II